MLLKQILFLWLLNGVLYSQNMAPNGFFEDQEDQKTIHKPNKKSGTKRIAPDWKILNGAPDFFNDYKSTYLGYPIIQSINRGGKIGLEMYNKKNEVEGIYTELNSPLEKGKTYRISFSVAHCQYSDFVVKQFPFMFSEEVISEFDIRNNEQTVLNVIQLDTHITYKDKWVSVNGIYKAKGGEKYFSLTNTRFRFTKKKHISRVMYKDASKILNKEMDDVAYYFFDNIEVVAIDDSNSYCKNTEYLSPKDITVKSKLLKLKQKGIVHEDSPLEFDQFKNYTHHIFLFDVSSSMTSNIPTSKQIFNRAFRNIPENDLITGIKFESSSQYLFQRQNKSAQISARVNSLSASGGTTLQTGLDLVNKSIRSNEKTKFYLITDVSKTTTDTYMTQYIYLKLILEKHGTLLSTFKYPNFDEKKDSISFNKVFNETAIKHLPKKIPTLRFFESKLSREIREMMNDPNVNEEKSKLVFIKDCQFNQANKNDSIPFDHTIHSTNYVFLVDASSSMRQRKKYSLLKKSVLDFSSDLNPQDRISLVTFSNKTSLILDRIKSEESNLLRRELNKISLNGMTNIDKGLTYVYKFYRDHETDQNISLVLFTDGLFTISSKVKRYIKTDKYTKLQVYQFGNQTNQELEKLARNSNLNYNKLNMEEENIKVDIDKTPIIKERKNIYSDKISWRTFFSRFRVSKSENQLTDFD